MVFCHMTCVKLYSLNRSFGDLSFRSASHITACSLRALWRPENGFENHALWDMTALWKVIPNTSSGLMGADTAVRKYNIECLCEEEDGIT